MTKGKQATHFRGAGLASVAALAACVVLGAGTASAKYMADGAVQNGVTGGWVTPSDGICVLGLAADGTMAVDTAITNRRDCDARRVGDNTTTKTQCTVLGTCVGDLTKLTPGDCAAGGVGTWTPTVGNDGSKHAWAGSSTCVTVDASSGFPSATITGTISLKDVDRTGAICNALGGYLANDTAHVSASATGGCIAHSWQFRGQNATGAPLPFGASGTSYVQGQTGFCSAFMDTGLGATSCPTTYGYIVHDTLCDYQLGIAGPVDKIYTSYNNQWNPYKDIYGKSVAVGTVVDLSTAGFDTMGECLAAGFTWVNWIPEGPGATRAAAGTNVTIAQMFDFTKQAPDADEGCLHCHSKDGAQYNGPAERWKDSYLKTGHKNMLRKVTAGKNWAGPNAHGELEVYSAYAAGTLNFTNATAQVSSVDKTLLYIFGDWMAPAPGGLDVIVDMGASGAKYNGTGNYSCAPCHTTGWSKPTAGLCNYSSITSQAACEAVTSGAFGAGVWYPMVGVEGIGDPGYVAQEPAASFPGINFNGAGAWDLDGIQCGRCHNATVPSVTAAQIAASAFPATYETKGGMGNVPSGPPGTWATNLCFSCHQSIAKTNNGTGADADLAHPEALPVKNTATAPTYVPGFSGHVLGGSFLNSVHGRATATIQPNSLGKYDIASATYSSTFTGYTCWQSSTSSSPAMTWIDSSVTTQVACEAAHGEWSSGACIKEIKDKAKCESLYGTGAWRAGAQGSCVTCHDVHNSLFVAEQEERALRKTCVDCHVNNSGTGATVDGTRQIDIDGIRHLKAPGTPFEHGDAESCVVCHMPKPTSGDFPMHVWRINSDQAYNTFPTACEFGIGAGCTATSKIANTAPDGSYTNAVWVDVDLACGQCHGGTAGAGATKNNAMYRTKAELVTFAKGMHEASGVTYPVTFSTVVAGLDVTTLATVGCDTSCPTFTYDWDWGDTNSDLNSTASKSHNYAVAGTYTIKLTVKTTGGAVGSVSRSVTVTKPLEAPVADGTCTFDPNTWTASVTSNSTKDTTLTLLSTTVSWGDGAKSVAPKQALTHTYIKAKSVPLTVKISVVDSAMQAAGPTTLSCTPAVQPASFTISGTVKNTAGTVNLKSAAVILKRGTLAVATKYTDGSGNFTAAGLKPGTYTLTVKKAGYTFASPAATITVGPSSPGNTINAIAP